MRAMYNPGACSRFRRRGLEHILMSTNDASIRDSVEHSLQDDIRKEFEWRLNYGSKVQTWLTVPDHDRQTVYSLGAYRDRVTHGWFVPPRKPLRPFIKWLPPGFAPDIVEVHNPHQI